MSTSSIRKKPCCKCNKGGGVFTCDGCQQSFCRKHTDEHRQELSVQMDHIGQEHDIFQRDLNKEMNPYPLLFRIDNWERESINKIQRVAKQARVDLRKRIDQSRMNLKISMNHLTNELQSSRDSEDYTEIDLNRWLQRLKELRNELEKSLDLNVIDDDDGNRSAICLIKVSEQLNSCSSKQSISKSDQNCQVLSKSIPGIPERFEETVKEVLVSENGLLARCCKVDGIFGSTVCGIRRYSSNIHRIRFRIEQKKSSYLFFGITTHDQVSSQLTFAAPSANGWWELKYYINDGKSEQTLSTVTVQAGDEITLVLDCDQREIHFQYHRTSQMAKMSIDLEKCPFPWRIIITMSTAGDCVRILDNHHFP